MALRIKEPKIGDWDYDGVCNPEGRANFNNKTFSVGVFQWVEKTSGKGMKRSPVLHRVKGQCSEADEVYKKAEQYIKQNRLEGKDVYRILKRRKTFEKPLTRELIDEILKKNKEGWNVDKMARHFKITRFRVRSAVALTQLRAAAPGTWPKAFGHLPPVEFPATPKE